MLKETEGFEYRDWLTYVTRIAFQNNPCPEVPATHDELVNAIELGNHAAVAMSRDYGPWVRANAVAYFLMQNHEIEIANTAGNDCGVYILFNDTDILYVGQSKNVKSRISNHSHIPFSNCLIIYTDELNLIAFEAIAIGFLRPMMNFSRSDRYSPIVSEVSRCHEYGQ